MGAHARFSPSAANRLIHCPPSLVLGEAFQEEESPYAAGNPAHFHPTDRVPSLNMFDL